MINVPTVLILGAGASVDMGYPTGGDLRKSLLQPRAPAGPQAAERSKYYSQEQVAEFQSKFHDCQLDTIDSFLDLARDYRPIGKYLIAEELFAKENNERIMFAGEKCWYKKLRDMIGPSVAHLRKSMDHLKIVSFNYDRSLEQYLYRAFSAVASVDDLRVLPDLLGNLGFIHVHGILARLDWQAGGNGLAYGQAKTGKDLFSAAAEMLHTYDENDVSYAGVPAGQLIAAAKRVAILGFGYDERNMDKIGLPKGPVSSAQHTYIATTRSLPQRRVAELKHRFQMGDTYDKIEDVFATMADWPTL